MKTIYLIRHGQAQAGTTDYDRLSPLGRQQSIVLGSYLRTMTPDIGSVWSGDLKRQLQTSRLAHRSGEDIHHLPGSNGLFEPQIHTSLNEYQHQQIHRHYDTVEPVKGTESHEVSLHMTPDRYTKIIQSWVEDLQIPSTTGFLSFQEFQSGAVNSVKTIARESDANCIACYSSGGTISSIVAQIKNLDPTALADLIWNMKNTSITTVRYDEDHLDVVSVNNVDHLLKESKPELITAI